MPIVMFGLGKFLLSRVRVIMIKIITDVTAGVTVN
jgi:hypothetical protein